MLFKYVNINKNYCVLVECRMFKATLYGFWKNLSGHFERFACNYSLCTGSTVVGQCMEQLPNGYALITGVLPVTLRARFAHVKLFLQFYRRIVQTDSLRFSQNPTFL